MRQKKLRSMADYADAYDDAFWEEPPFREFFRKQRIRITCSKNKRWAKDEYARHSTIYAGRK